MATSDNSEPAGPAAAHQEGRSRRDFIFLAGGAVGAFAVGAAVWPLIDNLNPAQDTLAESVTEIDLTPIKQGQAVTVKWRGSPIFIRHRTKTVADKANAVPMSALRDPQTDVERFGAWPREQWLVVIGICTHLGCVPLGQNPGDNRGEFGGWFCPCHGSQYDTSGRIRKGPAPKNLYIPPYTITKDNKLIIGVEQKKTKKPTA
jgi:ubiquinol-cytochrome c reductase iron-sulfur subunit